MEIRVLYSPDALEATVKYVSVHNKLLYGMDVDIRRSIMDAIQELVDQFPRTSYIHQAGFYVWVSDYIEEGIDHDENVMNIEFMVDPALGMRDVSFSYQTFTKKQK